MAEALAGRCWGEAEEAPTNSQWQVCKGKENRQPGDGLKKVRPR